MQPATRPSRASATTWRMATTEDRELSQLLQILDNYFQKNNRRSHQPTIRKLAIYNANPHRHRLAIADLARRTPLPNVRVNKTRPERFDFLVENPTPSTSSPPLSRGVSPSMTIQSTHSPSTGSRTSPPPRTTGPGVYSSGPNSTGLLKPTPTPPIPTRFKPSDSSISSSWSLAVSKRSTNPSSTATAPPIILPDRQHTNVFAILQVDDESSQSTHAGSTQPPGGTTLARDHPTNSSPLSRNLPFSTHAPSVTPPPDSAPALVTTIQVPTMPMASIPVALMPVAIDDPILFSPSLLHNSPLHHSVGTEAESTDGNDVSNNTKYDPLTDQSHAALFEYCERHINDIFLERQQQLLASVNDMAEQAAQRWLTGDRTQATFTKVLASQATTTIDAIILPHLKQLDDTLSERATLAAQTMKQYVEVLGTQVNTHQQRLQDEDTTCSMAYTTLTDRILTDAASQIRTIMDSAVSELSEHVAIHQSRLDQHTIHKLPALHKTIEEYTDTHLDKVLQDAKDQLQSTLDTTLEQSVKQLQNLHRESLQQSNQAVADVEHQINNLAAKHMEILESHLHVHLHTHPHASDSSDTLPTLVPSDDHTTYPHGGDQTHSKQPSSHHSRNTPWTSTPTGHAYARTQPRTWQPTKPAPQVTWPPHGSRHPTTKHAPDLPAFPLDPDPFGATSIHPDPQSHHTLDKDKRVNLQSFAKASLDQTLHSAEAKSIMTLYHGLYFLCQLHQIPLKHADHLSRNSPVYPTGTDEDPHFHFYCTLIYEKLNGDDVVPSHIHVLRGIIDQQAHTHDGYAVLYQMMRMAHPLLMEETATDFTTPMYDPPHTTIFQYATDLQSYILRQKHQG